MAGRQDSSQIWYGWQYNNKIKGNMEKTFNAVELIQTISNKHRHKKSKNYASVENEIASLGEYLGTDQMQDRKSVV